jgi:hypothetical protein
VNLRIDDLHCSVHVSCARGIRCCQRAGNGGVS